jgi:hypothetical protein
MEVRANGVPDESPKDEVGIMFDVVPEQSVTKPILFSLPTVGSRSSDSSSKEDDSTDASDEMPRGYMMDVGSLVTVMPGREILFSIPINYISKRWHIEIPLEFQVPPGDGKTLCDPKNSLGPTMTLSYGIWDLPEEYLDSLKRR